MKRILLFILGLVSLGSTVLPASVVSADTLTLHHVIVTPSSINLLIGGTQQFTATGEDANKEEINNLTYSWEIVNGGGTINNSGLFTAGTTAGTFSNTVKVTAIQGTISVTGFASVNVFTAAGTLDHVVISPVTVTLPAGGTQQFTAQGHDINCLPIATGVTYNWEVVNNGGTISNLGLFTAGDESGIFTNTVKVTATSETISKTALATIIVNSGPNKNKNGFSPFGWLQGLKKGWQGLHFPPGWIKNGKANQTDSEISNLSSQGKGNQNKNKNK